MNPSGRRSVRVVGPGRAGRSLLLALGAAGWVVEVPIARGDRLRDAARDVDLLVLATPDAALADVAAEVRPEPGTVVAHLAGSLGLDVLAPHPMRAGLHPLVSLPAPEVGARRLAGGAWFGLAGDPPEALELVRAAVADLGGRSFVVADADRAAYHAAAAIASNHLVALMGQVERVAATAGVPFEAYLDLARGSLANVAQLGPVAALTGPVARGDRATLERHRSALAPDEVATYDALVAAARRLVDDREGPGGADDVGRAEA